jgi:Bifunctional DNA primase/polymerase, N-terminal
VYSASSNPSIFSRWDWNGAACAIATGGKVEVLDVDVRGAVGALPLVGQGNPPAWEGGIDGFATLKSLGLDWHLIQTLTLCASTPSSGVHAWFKPVSGKSRTLGPGGEWFSTGKYVVAPPAPGRLWLNDLPIAEAPEELKRIVLASHTLKDAGRNFPGPLMTGPNAKSITSTKVPKPIYLLILRLMRKAERRDQRRAAGLFNVVALKRSGRNNALNYAAWAFRELVENGAIEASGACKLLVEACKANGYLAKDGAEAVRLTIMSGLGVTEWPEEVAQHNPFTAQERRV